MQETESGQGGEEKWKPNGNGITAMILNNRQDAEGQGREGKTPRPRPRALEMLIDKGVPAAQGIFRNVGPAKFPWHLRN